MPNTTPPSSGSIPEPSNPPADRGPERQLRLRQAVAQAFPDLDYFGRLPHPDNLRGSDLHGLDLRGFDLAGADLSWANLRDADLRGASLTDALLYAADLHGTQLPGGQDLQGVDFQQTNLVGLIDMSALKHRKPA